MSVLVNPKFITPSIGDFSISFLSQQGSCFSCLARYAALEVIQIAKSDGPASFIVSRVLVS